MKPSTLAAREDHRTMMLEYSGENSAELRSSIGRRAKAYSCRCCQKEFIALAIGRHWYCGACRAGSHYLAADARTLVQRAIKSGVLSRADSHKCADCDKQAKHWDHRDYSRPLVVEPVCHSCNMKRGPGYIAPMVAA